VQWPGLPHTAAMRTLELLAHLLTREDAVVEQA
jgi:hypothetical protein